METTAIPPVVITWDSWQDTQQNTHQLRMVYDSSVRAVTVTASELHLDGSGQSAIWELSRDEALSVVNLLLQALNLDETP